MAIAEKKDLYTFPGPPDAVSPEWPGTPIGAKNTVTRTKGRTAVHDKTVDRKPGLFRRLVANAVETIASSGQRTYSHDVVIHGLRVRAITNSEHLIGYWKDNWYGIDEWLRITGKRAAETPDVLVIALGRVPTEAEAAYYSRQNDTVIFFNTSYYGQLKSWVLGAVGRKLAVDYGVHSIHGAVVTKDGKGILYIAPTGTGKSTSTYGVMEFPNTRFHSDDWVYVRYANKATIDAIQAKLQGKPPFDRMGESTLRTTIARFFAFDNTRAMLDITTVFPKERVFTNPMEPARINAVLLIKRNFDEDVVVERLSIDKFMARLLIGLTPAGTKEIVYNSYRAVDDKSERAWIDTIEAKGVDRMWGEYQKAKDKPETLNEEMEMFRMLFKSAAAYDLNTVLQKDKAIGSKMEAVQKTMKLIVAALDNTREDFRYTITDYRKLVE